MTTMKVSLSTVNLDNCDKEPIHVPGLIQPHGALIAFDVEGRLTHASRNAAPMLAELPQLGARPSRPSTWLYGSLADALDNALTDAGAGLDVQPVSLEITIDGVLHDVVVHAYRGRVTVEFERGEADAVGVASFALLAHRSMSRMRGRADFTSILSEAVKTVRELTGFDRVMAYRFHSDDSGEIVAEAKIDALTPYLGRRFPASDIPVQARRLYVANTLRLIANVNDEQVPVDALDPSALPLDMTHSILRSVSPIHIEYLKNINVAASMSVSIVVNGKLWGLIACHHQQAHRVPYAVRMACDVLANVISSAIQVVDERITVARRAAATDLRAKLADLSLQGDDLSLGLGLTQAALSKVIPCAHLIFSHGSQTSHDGVEAAIASDLLRWLDPQLEDLLVLNDLSRLPSELRALLKPVGGLLALRHDRVRRGWIVLLRHEQTASVLWSGPPDKAARVGPLGARLTPDGSLAEWRQDVAGRAEAWDELDLTIARQILDELTRASALRLAEMDRARTHLLAILGHDLRAPLQSINMAAHMLKRGGDQSSMAGRITASSGRMGRLINQVLDMSRLQGGLGLGLVPAQVNLSSWITSLVEEATLAYPDVGIQTDIQPDVQGVVDADRLAQVVSNLLSNARHHGTLGDPIILTLRAVDLVATLEVANAAPPLSESLVAGLFDPLKRGSVANERNPNGLGLGLYIASEVVKGHAGTLTYRYEADRVMFSARFPLKPTS
jgi:chemotaxis family two-component system sensor kinase Cph1